MTAPAAPSSGSGSQALTPGTSAALSMAPCHEAPAGAPGTGEAQCRNCGGSGRAGGETCAAYRGMVKVNVGIGGG